MRRTLTTIIAATLFSMGSCSQPQHTTDPLYQTPTYAMADTIPKRAEGSRDPDGDGITEGDQDPHHYGPRATYDRRTGSAPVRHEPPRQVRPDYRSLSLFFSKDGSGALYIGKPSRWHVTWRRDSTGSVHMEWERWGGYSPALQDLQETLEQKTYPGRERRPSEEQGERYERPALQELQEIIDRKTRQYPERKDARGGRKEYER